MRPKILDIFKKEILIKDKTGFGAIRKYRTIDNSEYGLAFGIGINKAIRIELSKDNTIIKNFEIGEDGVYENGKKLIIEDELYYKVEDTLKLSDVFNTCGYVTGSAKDIRFTVQTPKLLNNISNIEINNLALSIRLSNGGYIISNSADFKIYATVENKSENSFTIKLHNDDGWGVTNNIPVSVNTSNLKVTFK